MNARADAADACDLRFGQVGLACVRVLRADAAALCDELERRERSAPQVFSRTAVVLDLSHLAHLPDDGAVDALLEAVRSAGMLPVGLAYGTSETEALARRMGLPVIAKFRAAYEPSSRAAPAPTPPAPVSAPAPTEPPHVEPAAAAPAEVTLHHDGTVRSGQQIYARNRDLVVTGTVANGAEVIADGDIHVYGALRGRAMAGAQGDTNARIYAHEFHAELVAIAGHYRVFEQMPEDLESHSVQCWLEGEKLLASKL